MRYALLLAAGAVIAMIFLAIFVSPSVQLTGAVVYIAFLLGIGTTEILERVDQGFAELSKELSALRVQLEKTGGADPTENPDS